jgi:hypothetical protein
MAIQVGSVAEAAEVLEYFDKLQANQILKLIADANVASDFVDVGYVDLTASSTAGVDTTNTTCEYDSSALGYRLTDGTPQGTPAELGDTTYGVANYVSCLAKLGTNYWFVGVDTTGDDVDFWYWDNAGSDGGSGEIDAGTVFSTDRGNVKVAVETSTTKLWIAYTGNFISTNDEPFLAARSNDGTEFFAPTTLNSGVAATSGIGLACDSTNNRVWVVLEGTGSEIYLTIRDGTDGSVWNSHTLDAITAITSSQNPRMATDGTDMYICFMSSNTLNVEKWAYDGTKTTSWTNTDLGSDEPARIAVNSTTICIGDDSGGVGTSLKYRFYDKNTMRLIKTVTLSSEHGEDLTIGNDLFVVHVQTVASDSFRVALYNGNGEEVGGATGGSLDGGTLNQGSSIVDTDGIIYSIGFEDTTSNVWELHSSTAPVYTSPQIFQTESLSASEATTITAGLFAGKDSVPTNTTITYTAAADGSTFESITKNTLLYFASTGTSFKIKASLATTDAWTTPYVFSAGVSWLKQ